MKRKLRPLMIVDRPGPEDYNSTFDTQTNLLQAKINDVNLPEALVLVEHESVYTAGRGSLTSNFVLKDGKAIPCIEISRGGKQTYHGPGQLVAYPIFNLENFGKDVHVFLRKLEDVIISTLSCYEIRGQRREGLTGVWVEVKERESEKASFKKIAAIGIGVKKWVSYHGISINVNPDLSYFEAISPCGFDGKITTSINEILENPPTLAEVKQTLIDRFTVIFGLEIKEGETVADLKRRARPSWLKVKAPGSPAFAETLSIVKEHKLVTVCEEAKCPNMGECWTHGTATFMIMGELCTRRCSFCSVKDGALSNLEPLDPFEPLRVSQAVSRLGLKHVVITSVNRDDVADMGASHFDQTIRSIKKLNPDCDVEFLIPDMRGRRELVEEILKSKLLKVLNHNVETVPRLYKTVRPGADFKRSLNILSWAKQIDARVKTKSGLMVGLGEEKLEVLEVLSALRESNVDILTIGQYLQPTKKQLPVYRFVTPEEFLEYEVEAKKLGFSHVESGPLVRSSYHAWKHTGDLKAPREHKALSV